MSVGGSQQLRLFRRAIAAGATLEEACAATGTIENGQPIISLAEGRIYLAADAKNPPPPEAFELIGQPAKEPAMDRTARPKADEGEGAGISGEYKKPDAAKAFDIYDKQIKGTKAEISTLTGDLSQPFADIKKHAHFPRRVLDFIVGLEGMEDAKRDHNLLALSEGLKHRKLFLPSDLVTKAQGNDGGDVIPIGSAKKPQLATLPLNPSDGTEADLAEAGEDDDFTEATEEELAAQEGRRAAEPEAEAAE